MARDLDTKSQDILSYRPNISFVEPAQEPGTIIPIETPVQLEQVESLQEEVKILAKAVNMMATAIQARADEKAKTLSIALDPSVDAAVVASVKRQFGHEKINAQEITYAQYKYCKDRLRERGEELGQRTTITPEALAKAAQTVSRPGQDLSAVTQLGGYNTAAAKNGGLRPELQENARVIDPIDMDKFQAYIVQIFVNAIWEKFILPAFPDFVKSALPKQLCKIPADGFSAEQLVSMGVPVFGYEKK